MVVFNLYKSTKILEFNIFKSNALKEFILFVVIVLTLIFIFRVLKRRFYTGKKEKSEEIQRHK